MPSTTPPATLSALLLAPLIPWLAAFPAVPHDETVAAVATCAAQAALPRADAASASAIARYAARATGLPAMDRDGWWPRRVRRRAAIRTVRLAVRTLSGPAARAGADADPDGALRALLTDALTGVRSTVGLPAVPALTRPAVACRVSVPVYSELRAPYDAESLHHHVTALVDFWPRWLLDSMTAADYPIAR